MNELTKPDYIGIAMPLVERGFRVTPVHPETKMGVLKNWQSHQATTPEEVLMHAKYYPHHNVGVVGKRGVGRHCFLDIDADGVAERIEKESGHKMPKTYTVCSRPQSAPFKCHYYFVQTDYSFKQFGGWDAVNVNVRDLNQLEVNKNGNLQHPTLYDLKGVGGGSLVVAAGSVREDGEVYKCIDDSPVAEIPSWLVDWLVADIEKYRAAKAKEYASKLKQKEVAARLTEIERRELRLQNLPDGYDIAEEDTYDFLRWRASTFSGLGVTGEALVQVLTQQAIKFCQGGEALVQSEKGQRVIQKIGSEERHIGNAVWFYRKSPRSKKSTNLVLRRRLGKREIIRTVVSQFPDKLSKEEAIRQINEALQKQGFTLDKIKDRNALSQARSVNGFEVDGHHWKR